LKYEDILDDLFTKAILEARILRIGLENENVEPEKDFQKNNEIWELQKWEATLNAMNEKYISLLKVIPKRLADYPS